MKNSIIFKNELEFREYITYNSEEILKIFIFEDELDNIIFFYAFTNDLIVAAKENMLKPFSYYEEIYKLLSKKIKLSAYLKKDKVLKLTKNSRNTRV